MKTKILRRVLILAFLIGGVMIVGSNNSTCVVATTCADAFNNYLNANGTYETARLSFFYGSPTTCQQDCTGPNQPQCIHNCNVNRQTALGNAQTSLISLAVDTCTPGTTAHCDDARLIAQQCSIDFDYASYPDSDESLAVYSQYEACREASKIDTCQ